MVDRFVEWHDNNKLLLSLSKANDLVVDYRRMKMVIQPIFIKGEEVIVVSDFKYLGVHINKRLDCRAKREAIYKKGAVQIRLYRDSAPGLGSFVDTGHCFCILHPYTAYYFCIILHCILHNKLLHSATARSLTHTHTHFLT